MARIKLEYIWLDGYTPVAQSSQQDQDRRRRCRRFYTCRRTGWGFDGSSTQQAEGQELDWPAQAVAFFPDCTRKDSFLVMNEVMLPSGDPHPTNTRATIPDDSDAWFGFEQGILPVQGRRPLGFFPPGGYPAPQGPLLHRSWYKNVGCIRAQDCRGA